MAITVGELQVQLDATTTQLKQGLDEANRKIKRFETRTKKSTKASAKAFKRVGQAVLALGVALGLLRIGRIFKDLIVDAINTSAAFETYETQLANFLGTNEEAADTLQRFETLAAKTPFSIKEITQAGANLGAVAISNKEALFDLTFAASNLAAVTGLSLQQSSNNLQRAISGGIAAADLFRERGVRALVEAITGIPDLTKVPLAEQKRLILEVFGAGGIYAEAAESLNFTLGGAMSNLGDAFISLKARLGDTFAAGIIASLREGMIPLLESMTESIVKNHDAFRDLSFQGVIVLAKALVFLGRSFAVVINIISGFLEFLDRGRSKLAAFSLSIGFLGNLVGAVDDATLEVLNEEFNRLATQAENGQVGLNKFKEALDTTANQAEKLARGLEKINIGEFETETDAAKAKNAELKAALEKARLAREAAELARQFEEGQKRANALRAAAEKRVLATMREQRLEALSLKDERLKEIFLLDEKIGMLVRDAAISGNEILAQQTINDLLRERNEIQKEVDRGAGSIAAEQFGKDISTSFTDAVKASAKGEGGFGKNLTNNIQGQLDQVFDKSVDKLAENMTKSFADVAGSLGGLFDKAFSGLGENLSGALGAAVAGLAALALSSVLGGGNNSSSSSGANDASAVDSSQAIRGLVVGPQEIAIAKVGFSIKEANAPLLAEAKVQTTLLQAILESGAAASITDALTLDEEALAFQSSPLAQS